MNHLFLNTKAAKIRIRKDIQGPFSKRLGRCMDTMRIISVFLILFFALSFLPAAFAEVQPPAELPIDPNRQQVITEYQRIPNISRATSFSVSLSRTSSEYFNGASWSAACIPSSGSYEYLFQLIRYDSDLDWSDHELVASQKYSSKSTFTYQFIATGNYELRVWVKDLNFPH